MNDNKIKKSRQFFMFKKEFYNATKLLDNSAKLDMYEKIIEYGLYGKEKPYISTRQKEFYELLFTMIDNDKNNPSYKINK